MTNDENRTWVRSRFAALTPRPLPESSPDRAVSRPAYNGICFWLVLALTLGTGFLMMTRSVSADEDNIRNYVELMRADLSAAKVQAITERLKLSDAEAKAFWPLYRQYEVELAKEFSDPRLELIRQFITAQNADKLDDKLAKELSAKFFALQKTRISLWEKYCAKISAAVSPTRAAQFVQVEHQVALLVDTYIASEMPAVGSKP